MNTTAKNTDIICIGESLIDFIGHQKEAPIAGTKDYHRYLGGSPTNVAMNMSRLGLRVAMVASVGDDGLGTYIIKRLDENKINTQGIQRVSAVPTSVIFVSRTEDTPEFIPYRGADFHIYEAQISDALIAAAKIFHTTCFALSKNPAQATILKKAEVAYRLGSTLSIDLNYSEKIWPDSAAAKSVIQQFCRYNPLIKISQDDIDRLFGNAIPPDEAFAYFHQWGANVVCLTLGKKGAILSQSEKEPITLPAQKIEKVIDATGAGDAFWSGFLFAWLNEKSPKKCMETALQLAAIKLQNVGRIPDYAKVLSGILSK